MSKFYSPYSPFGRIQVQAQPVPPPPTSQITLNKEIKLQIGDDIYVLKDLIDTCSNMGKTVGDLMDFITEENKRTGEATVANLLEEVRALNKRVLVLEGSKGLPEEPARKVPLSGLNYLSDSETSLYLGGASPLVLDKALNSGFLTCLSLRSLNGPVDYGSLFQSLSSGLPKLRFLDLSGNSLTKEDLFDRAVPYGITRSVYWGQGDLELMAFCHNSPDLWTLVGPKTCPREAFDLLVWIPYSGPQEEETMESDLRAEWLAQPLGIHMAQVSARAHRRYHMALF